MSASSYLEPLTLIVRAMNRMNAVELHNMQKSFAGIPVLKEVNFSLRKGEVHALMGGNGAGKSTLMKILTGVYRRDSGDLFVNGERHEFLSPRDSEAAGIAMIFQELSLVPTLTVAQNIFLQREPRHGFILNGGLKDLMQRER